MTLSEIMPHLIYQFQSEHDLVKAIDELSINFTTKREKIDEYLKDPRLVSAYTAFYLLTNLPKWEAVLERLPDDFIDAIKKETFVDFGSGPGTFSLAYQSWFPEGEKDIFQIEISSLMKEQSKKIFHFFYPHKSLTQLQAPKELKDSFLFFGHSSNELGARNTIEVIKKISPKHILFIEPGTKDFFKEMIDIRSFLFENNFHQVFPCPHENECPWKKSDKDWCHQYIEVKHSQDVERLTQIAKKDRRMLPLTVAAFSLDSFKKETERIIRVHPETKFSFEWDVCHQEKVDRYQVLKRDLTKSEIKIFENALAGDSLKSELLKEFEDKKRVKVLSKNKFIL